MSSLPVHLCSVSLLAEDAFRLTLTIWGVMGSWRSSWRDLQFLCQKLKIVYSVLCLLVCQFWGKYFCCFLLVF